MSWCALKFLWNGVQGTGHVQILQWSKIMEKCMFYNWGFVEPPLIFLNSTRSCIGLFSEEKICLGWSHQWAGTTRLIIVQARLRVCEQSPTDVGGHPIRPTSWRPDRGRRQARGSSPGRDRQDEASGTSHPPCVNSSDVTA